MSDFINIDLDGKMRLMVARAMVVTFTSPDRKAEPNFTQFSIIGPRGAVKAAAWPDIKKLREVGRELIRLANELEGKTGLRCVRGGKS